MNDINYFSINNAFWVDIQNNYLSFGYKNLPKDVHFTLSYSENSKDVNLHLTKNTVNKKDKPDLRIFEIEKKYLVEDINSLTISFLKTILEKIDIVDLQNKYRTEIGFISFNNIGKPEIEILTKSELIENFKNITKIKRKTRLKIKGNIDESIESFIKSENLLNTIMENVVNLNYENEKEFDSGMIITDENIISVIRINQDWFKFRMDLKPIDIISSIMSPDLAKYIILKIEKEIQLIKDLNNKSESKKLSNPIRLVIQIDK